MLSGFVKRDVSLRMGLIGFDIEFVGVNIIKFEVSEFANTNTGLKQEFDDGMDTDVVSADVS